LVGLETGVLATLAPWRAAEAVTLTHYLDWCSSPAGHAEVRNERWYTGSTALPVAAEHGRFREAAERFGETCTRGQVSWGQVRSVVMCPARFNQLLDEWGSKGAVLGQGLAELLGCNRRPDQGCEPVYFWVDKHGGRNTYAPMLQHALAEGMVVAHEEGRERSVYSVMGLERPLRLTFQPRADAAHFCVALASMFSKYLREVLMLEFNQFWQTRVPGLKPTAGYPGDAARFFDQIRPAAQRLGIPEDSLWRRK
jgi:hypothetical protein